MKTYSEEEAGNLCREAAEEDDMSCLDNDGQIVIYTGVYEHRNNKGQISYHDEPQSECERGTCSCCMTNAPQEESCHTCEEDKDCEEHGPSSEGDEEDYDTRQ